MKFILHAYNSTPLTLPLALVVLAARDSALAPPAELLLSHVYRAWIAVRALAAEMSTLAQTLALIQVIM